MDLESGCQLRADVMSLRIDERVEDQGWLQQYLLSNCNPTVCQNATLSGVRLSINIY